MDRCESVNGGGMGCEGCGVKWAESDGVCGH